MLSVCIGTSIALSAITGPRHVGMHFSRASMCMSECFVTLARLFGSQCTLWHGRLQSALAESF